MARNCSMRTEMPRNNINTWYVLFNLRQVYFHHDYSLEGNPPCEQHRVWRRTHLSGIRTRSSARTVVLLDEHEYPLHQQPVYCYRRLSHETTHHSSCSSFSAMRCFRLFLIILHFWMDIATNNITKIWSFHHIFRFFPTNWASVFSTYDNHSYGARTTGICSMMSRSHYYCYNFVYNRYGCKLWHEMDSENGVALQALH